MLWVSGPCNSTLGPEIQRVADGMADLLILSAATSLSLKYSETHRLQLPARPADKGLQIHFPTTASPRATSTECVSACKRELTFVCNGICICRRCSCLYSRALTNECVCVCGHCWTFSEPFALFIVLLQVSIIKRRPICSACATSDHFEGHMASFGLIWLL